MASGVSDTIFYAVNDSGDSSRFFAVDTSGRLIATYHYKGSNPKFPLGVMDCEEMAYGDRERKSRGHLYGRIGTTAGPAVHHDISVLRGHNQVMPSTNLNRT